MSARALAKEGLAKALAFVQVAELQDPLPVFGQTVIVEHETGKAIRSRSRSSSAMTLAGLRLRTLRPKRSRSAGWQKLQL